MKSRVGKCVKIAQTESSHKEIAQKDNQKFASRWREIPLKGMLVDPFSNTGVSSSNIYVNFHRKMQKKNSNCV